MFSFACVYCLHVFVCHAAVVHQILSIAMYCTLLYIFIPFVIKFLWTKRLLASVRVTITPPGPTLFKFQTDYIVCIINRYVIV